MGRVNVLKFYEVSLTQSWSSVAVVTAMDWRLQLNAGSKWSEQVSADKIQSWLRRQRHRWTLVYCTDGTGPVFYSLGALALLP